VPNEPHEPQQKAAHALPIMPLTNKPCVSAPSPDVKSTKINPEATEQTDSGWGAKLGSALQKLGPGLVTGASDDDPSGIATYSQVGAQFGYGMLWTMVVSYPLMTAIQEISARVGRVTGCGISANLRKCYPKWLLYVVVPLMLTGNIFNLGADVGAMGASAQLLIPGRAWIYILLFGVISLLLQLFVPYSHYVKYLKWLTISLFAYVATAFFVRLSWRQVLYSTALPRLTWNREYLIGLIAVFGTTISPYLFFWQASQEVEEVKKNRGEKALKRAPRHCRLLHHPDNGCYAARARDCAADEFSRGRSGFGAPCRTLGCRAVRLRNHRHRYACHSCSGRFGGIRDGGGFPVASQPGR